uniref:VWFA and cache domain-containing protein 1 n=1 Tax=Magallana gigas TaxID=29159 RepID=K1QK79_MAGGI
MKVLYLLTCLFVVKHVIPQNAQEINGDILARELNKVADSVGWSFLQNEYNKLRYLETKPDGEKLVKEIAKKIGGRMEEVDIALKRLKEAVVEDQLSSANVPQDCCVDGEYQENVRFRTHVSEETFCYIRPSYVSGDDISFPTTKVLEAMKANLNVKHLQFQYIGLKTGLFINYPSTRLRDCDSYDPRFRPYFVSSTATIPRDVVVVLETSASMRGDKLFEAKHAALTVMETLGVKDRFGLVVFNDEANTLEGCYGNQVVPVTSTTKKSFRDFLNSQQAQKGADYDAALRKAFALLKGSSSVEAKDRDQILLFVSDGGDNSGTEGNPLEVIRDENEALNNNVVINTYGIGTGINSNEKQLLRNMAEQTLNNNSYGHVKRGQCEFITDLKTTSLRKVMGTYYKYDSLTKSTSPTYTQPYKDFFTNDGDSKRAIKAVFYWAPIAPGSNLSLCIVMERNNTVSDIENFNQPISGDFVYHRWDLNRWPAPFCRHFSRYATQAKTTVKLTPDAFKEASLYTGVKETGVRVKQLKDYISGDITTNPGLKTSAIKSIRLTYPMEKLWMTTSKEEAPYLVWRYVMTEDGVQRQYPGVRLTDDYDHKLRPCCILIDNSGFLVMHPYYIETTSPIEGQIHITYLEGKISRSLIEENIMYKQPCRDTGNKKEQFTYRVKLKGANLGGIIDSENGYELRPVSGSNVFLILKKRRSSDEDKCCDSEYYVSPSSIPCGTEECSCLCYKELSFNECRNEYNITECFRTSGCSWCKSDKNGNLVNGFCDLKEICPSQQCLKDVCIRKRCGPPECKNPPCDDVSNVVIYASASGGAVVVVILIIIVVCIIRKKKDGHDDTYLDATHEVTIFSKPTSDCIDYNTVPNCYTSTLSVTSEESVSSNAS